MAMLMYACAIASALALAVFLYLGKYKADVPHGAAEKFGSNDHFTARDEELECLKKLYYQLQNLEEHPDVLAEAKHVLISFLSQALEVERQRDKTILGLDHYTEAGLTDFIREQEAIVVSQWEQYLARRKDGGGRELFSDKESARHWLLQVAPVKLVDGAWLGRVHRITTPFALRRITKDAWQVMSEEYGDGHLEQHHVHLFKLLLRDAGVANLPDAHTAGFTHGSHGMRSTGPWRAGVAQLLVSLFPHDFLPEMLGYNLHFELLTLNTLKAAKELEEVRLSGRYFFLHISIDNSHSGHAAMALHTVVRYFDHVRCTEGPAAAERAWRRVQAGYCLSSAAEAACEPPMGHRRELDQRLLAIFEAKARVSQKLHCGSRVRLGRLTLQQWLAPEHFASDEARAQFLQHLAQLRPWVRAGDSAASKLVHALSWPGKMYGSFTHAELHVLRDWIDGLRAVREEPYITFIGGLPAASADERDVRSWHPVLQPGSTTSGPLTLPLPRPSPGGTQPVWSNLLPVWFACLGLLENFAAVPSRTANTLGCATIRLLRLYYGFRSDEHQHEEHEHPHNHSAVVVSGMDEPQRPGVIDMVSLGLRLVQLAGRTDQPTSLKECLELCRPCERATAAVVDHDMLLRVAMRPVENAGLLLGLAAAFAQLHDRVVALPALAGAERDFLRAVVAAERSIFQLCERELREAGEQAKAFERGFEVGSAYVDLCYF